MTRAVCFVLFLAGLLVPARAYPCGVGSDSSSNDSSSSGGGYTDYGSDYDSGDYDSSDGGSVSATCVHSSEIVGRDECRPFASWSLGKLPRLRFELGTSMHRFTVAGMAFAGLAEHDSNIHYRMTGDNLGHAGEMLSAGVDLRLVGAVGEHAYAGGAVRLAGVAPAPVRTMTETGLTVQAGDGLYTSFSALVGATFNLGGFTIRSEAQVGHRLVSIGVVTNYGDCVDESTMWDSRWEVRPQLAVETWLNPWISGGAVVSTDLLQQGDLAAGAYVGLHFRSFDGGGR